jgi:hypothetical protein
MATPIIAAIRQRRDLKESLLHTAQELAHLSSIYGVARVSLRYLARKCHCCKQTIINHLKQLIALKIIRKTVLWLKGNFCEINTYTFLVSWEKRPAKGGSQNSVPTLPPQEREKTISVREELENQRKGIRFLTPGSDLWQKVSEEIARLEALMLPRGDSELYPTAAAVIGV